MGGDTPPPLLFEAVVQAFEKEKKWMPVLFGSKEIIEKAPSSFETIVTTQVIHMEDDPFLSVRTKKESSLSVGIKALKNKEVDAFVSLGNTGALLISAKMTLDPLPSIERPAFLTLLPSKKKEMAILDVGATVSCLPEHFLQFAAMGIAFQKNRGIKSPKIGLLNIGIEEKKGTPALQESYLKLKSLKNFVGNIEGRDVFEGKIDILLTDGFTGNIFLKTAEGTASFILDQIAKEYPSFKKKFTALKKKMLYAEYPGAVLCGIDGLLLKCHGSSSPNSFIRGIKEAAALAQNNFIHKIKLQLGSN